MQRLTANSANIISFVVWRMGNYPFVSELNPFLCNLTDFFNRLFETLIVEALVADGLERVVLRKTVTTFPAHSIYHYE